MPARLKSRSARSSTTSGRFANVSGASHSPHCPSCPPIGPSCSRAEFCHFHHGLLGDLLETIWGKRTLTLCDPFSGGGSIPFEGLRYGFTTSAGELNPVAAVILKATLEYPATFGPRLAGEIKKYGRILESRV